MLWIIDGNNVMGSRPDGWWNDRPAAAARLTAEIALWCRRHDDQVVAFFDGKPDARVAEQAGGNLEIRFAPGSGAGPQRDAADDEIVEFVGDLLAESASPSVDVVVVTADRGLRERLPPGIAQTGPGAFLDTIGAPRSARTSRAPRGGRGR